MRTMARRCGALLVLAVALAACAGPGLRPEAPAPLAAWSQLGPDGRLQLRAVVAAGAACPEAAVDGGRQPMRTRAAAKAGASGGTNPAFAADFPVIACELDAPAGTRTVAVADRALPVAPAAAQRIVVLGDTGCRIKVAFSGQGDPVQDCTDPAAWPWARLAAAAARRSPDLVIHVGDYHYREACDDPAFCDRLAARGVAVGYGWSGWEADFFGPAAPLLAAAPWVMVRGNHENCDRAGEGWMRFLSPQPYVACPDQRYRTATRSVLANNLSAPAYRIDAGAVSLLVVDNAGHEDYRRAGTNAGDEPTFGETLRQMREMPTGRPLWLLSHRPLWYDLLAAGSEPNDFQNAVAQGGGDRFQLALSGHQHAFASYNFAPGADPAYPGGRPAQVIVGGGGTQLEAADPKSPFFERGDPGSRERATPGRRTYGGVPAASGMLLNRFGFLQLDRAGAGWDAEIVDPDGRTIVRCRLEDGRKELACPFPGR